MGLVKNNRDCKYNVLSVGFNKFLRFCF